MAATRSSFLQTTLGLKFLMALTGAFLVFFLVAHLAGNLLIYVGPDAINFHGQFLKDIAPITWALRVGLLAAFVAHIYAFIVLTARNRAARPERYVRKDFVRASVASRAMRLSGVIVLAFVVYHLAHFTFQVVNYTGPHIDAQGRLDIYTMVILGFQNPLISGFYILALTLLGVHLAHGIPSIFQTLGVSHPAYSALLERVGLALVAVLMFGFISIPLAVLTGLVSLS